MNQTLIACILLLIISGCGEPATTVQETKNGGVLRVNDGILTSVRILQEFDYKGHKYVSCKVRDGIALAHAGHCWCNSSNKN